jgi:sugar phosphate isomerase/epimerase
LGYEATYLTLWDESAWADVRQLGTVRQRFGLDVAAVFAEVFIDAPDNDRGNGRIIDLLRSLEGTRTVELTLRWRDPAGTPASTAGDGPARRWLERLLSIAAERGITLALYPHIRWWLERTEEAVRLCQTIDHPLLRMTFPAFHWYAVDGRDLPQRLAEAAPYLSLVNVCGSRRYDNGSGNPATIEPLDDGELDVFAVLGAVRAVGFDGPVGIQGYSVGGDAYAKLRRSLAAFRDIERRLDAHPDWATLRPPG